MCGIAGIINFNGQPVSETLLKKATDTIAHRGPDGEGHWTEGNVGIGHRRLSIIDLSPAGKQPMLSMDDRFVLSYNGEVYNFNEIRSELEKRGERFRSNTDSEVILSALSIWGNKALLKFNGMFSLAFFDRKNKKLLLARDRYGIKPLYYSHQRSVFSFASEQKAILTNPSFKSKINKEALLEYFTFQNIFTDQTLIDDIHLLPPGHFLEVDINNAIFKKQKYWDYHFENPSSKVDIREYREELRRLFNQAVNRQLIGDVELGSYLSGGIDSGSISAIASQSIENLKTFTCGFDLSSASGIELAFDERDRAEAMSALFKTEHYQMVLKAGDMERCLSDLSWHLEEPRVGQSYPNYYAAKLASKFVKVILSGSGGDEIFGGYPWRYYRTLGSKDFDEYIDDYYLYWQRILSNSEIKDIFSPIWKDVQHVWTRDIFSDVFLSHSNKLRTPEDYINHSLYFECKTFLHGLFVVEDKLSMAHSLENRVPFMDNDLVEFAQKCPVEFKLNNTRKVISINENEPNNKKNKYFEKTNDGKQILRDVMAHYVPDFISKSNKQGFSSPDASWFKGESIEFVKRNIFNDNAKIYDYFDSKKVKSIVDSHLNGQKNKRLFIWSLLNFESFLENYNV